MIRQQQMPAPWRPRSSSVSKRVVDDGKIQALNGCFFDGDVGHQLIFSSLPYHVEIAAGAWRAENFCQVKRIKMLVLDEADEMLSKGFKEQVLLVLNWDNYMKMILLRILFVAVFCKLVDYSPSLWPIELHDFFTQDLIIWILYFLHVTLRQTPGLCPESQDLPEVSPVICWKPSAGPLFWHFEKKFPKPS